MWFFIHKIRFVALIRSCVNGLTNSIGRRKFYKKKYIYQKSDSPNKLELEWMDRKISRKIHSIIIQYSNANALGFIRFACDDFIWIWIYRRDLSVPDHGRIRCGKNQLNFYQPNQTNQKLDWVVIESDFGWECSSMQFWILL